MCRESGATIPNALQVQPVLPDLLAHLLQWCDALSRLLRPERPLICDGHMFVSPSQLLGV